MMPGPAAAAMACRPDRRLSGSSVQPPVTRHASPVTRHTTIALLILTFALGMTQVVHASITFDEGPHLAVGYTTLRTGDLRLQPVHIHPPLANALSGAPLLFQRDLPDPTRVDGWEIASLSAITDSVVWAYPHPRRIATAGRVPILLLGTLTGALVYRWARDVAKAWAGTLALGLYALDPNAIAHSALITTDACAVLLGLATLYALRRALRAPPETRRHRRSLITAGILLGMAQLTKVSALMLIPVSALILLAVAWKSRRRADLVLRYAVIRTLVLVGIAALVVWAGYGFEVRSIPGLPLPVPAATHIEILRSLSDHYDLGHPTFALGRVSTHGWWWYFALAFALKTPCPVLLLLFATVLILVCHLRRGAAETVRTPVRRHRLRGHLPSATEALTLGLFPLLYAGASLFSTVNIGYRHLLPILPFLYIVVGVVLSKVRMAHRDLRPVGRATLGALLIWLAAGTLATLPYPLTFFNELAGGPAGGYRLLVDSNLDWGQNLWDLADWMDRHGERHVYYAHFSPARPQTYGINADFLPPDPRAVPFAPWHPAPGLYAIGATVLQGPYAPDLNTFAWFRDRTPIARLGHALFLYRVEESPAPVFAVVCVPGLDAGGVQRRLGVPDLRVIRPDCEQTRVYPKSETPGLIVIQEVAPSDRLGEPQLSLRSADGGIAAVVVRISQDHARPEIVPSSGAQTVGPLAFTGHTLGGMAGGEATAPIVWTFWEVREHPTRPLSLMAHLVDTDGTTVAIGDGLGFPIEQWQVGDLIVQAHAFGAAGGVPQDKPLRVIVGGYWLDTLERWPTDDGSAGIDLGLTRKP